MDKVQHFEIPADDTARAQEFYKNTFGWEINQFPMPDGQEYLGMITGPMGDDKMPSEPGFINGGLFKRNPSMPVTGPVIAATVSDINNTLEKVKSAGGEVLTDILPVADMGLYAYIKDTEGNVIGIWQNLKKME